MKSTKKEKNKKMKRILQIKKIHPTATKGRGIFTLVFLKREIILKNKYKKKKKKNLMKR